MSTVSTFSAAELELTERLTAAGVDLPGKLRVHELAKRAGLSSKDVVAALAAIGQSVGSSSSSVTAEVAASLLASLLPVAPESAAAAPAESVPAESVPADEAPAKTAPARTRSSKRAAGKARAAEAPAAEAPAAEAPAVEAPAAEAPATAAPIVAPPVAEEPAVAQIVETAEAPARPARRRRASKPAGPPAVADVTGEVGAVEAVAPEAPVAVQAPRTNPALTAALADLPSRSRVHELAKRAGLKAKDVLDLLTAQGVVAKSANSVIGSDDATTLLNGVFGGAPASAEAPAEGPVQDSFGTSPLFIAPDAPAPIAVETTDDTENATAPREGGRSGRNRRGRGRNRGAEQPETSETVESPIALPAEELIESAEPVVESGEQARSEQDDADQAEENRRRRRRGRRGRGRVGDRDTEETTDSTDSETDPAVIGDDDEEPTATEASAVASSEADTDDDQDQGEDQDDTDDQGGASNSRRRRRRRRGAGSDDAARTTTGDDPVDTVVHVRETRSAESQVQGVRGSTRLEAKRQRRRDTRDTRRRPQILTEAEFLARRESVHRVMAVRQRGELAQVALLEDGVLVEHFVSRAGSASMIGNVYVGRVQNVLPSMEAAFIDIGRGRNAVLYAGEVNWDAAGLAGKSRKIETALSSGQSILVQVSKDPVGHKGARLTTQISLPGRFLVYVPNGGATGISRKLPDTERKRLKSILDRIVPSDAGVIIRTAAEGVSEDELARDVERLKLQWEEILRSSEINSSGKQTNPEQLYSEPDTLIKVVRDLFNSDITELIIDGESAWESLSGYVDQVAPELAPRVSRYTGRTDVFAAYRIDEQIAKALERKVHLPSGGSLVIDRTEAMTVVDVNTGKYTGSGGNLEETVTKNNLEAAEEVVRQLRLRDIGGIIVVDFIDMVLESNRELVVRRLTECLGRDRTRHQVAEVTSLGLIQMTRKKMGTGLVEAFSEPCPHCHGRGIVLHDAPVDLSPESAPEQQRSGESEGRNRRGRGRDRAPITADPVVDFVIPVVAPRPPDPRGPKPPTRSERANGIALDLPPLPVGETDQAEEPTVLDVDAIVDQVLAGMRTGSQAETVEIAVESGVTPEPIEPAAEPVETEVAEAVAAVVEPEARSRSSRRRAGRGRNRGQQAETPPTDLPTTEAASADEDAALEPLEEVTVGAVTDPVEAVEAAADAVTEVVAELLDAVAVPDIEEPVVKPKRVRPPTKAALARQAKAEAEAAAAEAVEAARVAALDPETAEAVADVVEPTAENPEPVPSQNGHLVVNDPMGADPEQVLEEVQQSKPAPRRRRAASRPAGPPV